MRNIFLEIFVVFPGTILDMSANGKIGNQKEVGPIQTLARFNRIGPDHVQLIIFQNCE